MRMWSTVLQHLTHPQTPVTKNKQTHGSESILVTKCYIYLKCYLKFYKIVPVKMESNYISDSYKNLL